MGSIFTLKVSHKKVTRQKSTIFTQSSSHNHGLLSPSHKFIILTKFCKDWATFVSFLLKANFFVLGKFSWDILYYHHFKSSSIIHTEADQRFYMLSNCNLIYRKYVQKFYLSLFVLFYHPYCLLAYSACGHCICFLKVKGNSEQLYIRIN